MNDFCKHTKKLESTEGVIVVEWFHLPSGHDFGATCEEANEARNPKYNRVFDWRNDKDAKDTTEERPMFPQNDIVPNRWD